MTTNHHPNPASSFLTLDAAAEQDWDAIIIGAGMGGGVTAYKLANAGKKVLLLEKGLSRFKQADGVVKEERDIEKRLNSGRWPTQLTAKVDGKTANIWAPLGCGVGGSTLLYAAALQRLRPEDFDSQRLDDGTVLEWPYSYVDIEPFYKEAETLFSVCGSPDPIDTQSEYDLLTPPEMSEMDQHLFEEFQNAGAQPYRLHTAIKYDNPCSECSGHICQRACKQDAKTASIEPALATGNLFIVERAEVLKFETDDKCVTQVLAESTGRQFGLKAAQYVLAAGAYFSPIIMQQSKNAHWPNGLANDSGALGRNLMFHASDFIAVWPLKKCSREGPNKTIAFRDLYTHENKKLGEFQSTGSTAGYGNVVYALRLMFDQSPLRKLSFLRHFLRIPAFIGAKIFGDASVFATIVEDYPYPENRVVADDSAASGMRVEYSIREEFRERVLLFRKLVQKKLKHLKTMPMAMQISLNYGHPCGTCRAGNDPKTSVLDANCKANGLDNLYVVDGSFMPTSGGTNPSLTIAANAMKVATHLISKTETK